MMTNDPVCGKLQPEFIPYVVAPCSGLVFGVDLAGGSDELVAARFEDGRLTAVFRGKEAEALSGQPGGGDNRRECSDVFERFIRERCVVDPDAITLNASLYNGYMQFCEENKSWPMTLGNFGRRMQDAGFERARKLYQASPVTHCKGVRLAV